MLKMTLSAALVKFGLRLPGENVGQFGAQIKALTPADREWFKERFAIEYGIEIVPAA